MPATSYTERYEILRARTKEFALRILKLSRSLPNRQDAWVLSKQLLRSGTSVGANHRAVCRARSKPEFIAKLGIVLEEADETIFWLELVIESGLTTPQKAGALLKEAEELTKIFAASLRTARTNTT